MRAISIGLGAVRDNGRSLAAIGAVSLAVALVYGRCSPVREFLAPLADAHARHPVLASVANRVFFCGIVPGLALLSSGRSRPRRLLLTLSAQADWNLIVRPIGVAASEKRAGLVARRPERIRSLVTGLGPDGILVEGGTMPDAVKLSDFRNLPTVFLDRCDVRGKRAVFCVRSDSERLAQVAFGELSKFGYGDYAFVPWMQPFDWSFQRGAAFARLAESSEGRFHPFPKRFASTDALTFVANVRRYLDQLPRPCAVFAVNDVVGECVLEVLADMGRRVPEEFAVLSVDNDRDICDNTSPSLSSIMLDFRQAGVLAAETLAVLMDGRRPVPPLFADAGIARRASTRLYRRADPRVRDAVEYVRRHACEGLRVADVVRLMGCSRRLAELRFREETDDSILGMIRACRRERAEHLLKHTTDRIADIAAACGYGDAEAFRKDFVRMTGVAPRVWRKVLRKTSAK